jgi:hypothetical protein
VARCHQASQVPSGARPRFQGKLRTSTFAVPAILRAACAILRDGDTGRERAYRLRVG